MRCSTAFLDRATAARPDFHITAENATTIAAICRRLGGLPLALELAAPWVRLLMPSEILGHLDRQLELLVHGSRDLPERQRSMRAALGWSCDLLDAGTLALLRRLSVFRGGVPMDALDGVCQAVGALPGGVMPHLVALVDHGLVARHDAPDGEPRMVLLETVREYGLELLAAAGEQEATVVAHLEHYTDLALRFDREVRSGAQAAWLQRLRRERDNLRAALDHAIEYGRIEAGLRLATALRRFWELDGCREKGLSWLDRLMAAAVDAAPSVLAQALKATGLLRWRIGSNERSVADLRTALAIFRDLGDQRGVAEAMSGLGNAFGANGEGAEAIRLLAEAAVLLRELDMREVLGSTLVSLGMYLSRSGDRTRATALYQEALDIYRDLDDALGMAMCLTNLGHQAHITGDMNLARTRLEAAVAAGRRMDAPFHLAAALSNLADVFRDQDEVHAARTHYREALDLFAIAADQSGIASCLRCLAWCAWRDGQTGRAVRLYGAAEAISPVAVSYDVDDAGLHERVSSDLRELVGDPAFVAAYDTGRRLPLSAAVAEGSQDAPRSAP
jgi:tetratricopeptide (TPR) repeat protein